MIEFVSTTGNGTVQHEAFSHGRPLWEGDDPIALLGQDAYATWPLGEAEQLGRYLQKHSDIVVTMEWNLSQETGVLGIAIVKPDHIDFYGSIFSLFESGPLEQVARQ
ncbi:hypothetical protein [Rhizobium sp. CCGE 510]|uniref:hypothetical protein n=1 Tax=Rhizobium sp. CCGE 510 TaxID=1132836 RepID=UPI00027B8E24|nr:hypothetical protein [Rhizobium sp. CCGE 510]EJT05014.1 hypothetical protein RCCGE510_11164 [Rhizobium sp. CCGE 510]